MSNDFYVILPSNSKLENVPSHFITELQKPIYLEEDDFEWAVGLHEIRFKNAVKTIDKDQIRVIEKTTLPKTEKRFIHDSTAQTKTKSKFNYPVTSYEGIEISTYSAINLMPNHKVFTSQDEPESSPFSITYKDDKYCHLVIENDVEVDLEISSYFAFICGFVEKDALKNPYVSFKNVTGSTKAPFYPRMIHTDYIPHMIITDEYTQEQLNDKYIIKASQKVLKTLKLTPGKYKSAKLLQKQFVNKTLNTYFEIKYDEKLNHFKILSKKPPNSSTHKSYYLSLENGLHTVLGFQKTLFVGKENCTDCYESELQADLQRGISNIFIYSDIVQYIPVGNVSAPLLRPITFNASNYGEMVNIRYQNPMYISLNKKTIHSIEVMLCDATGHKISFVEGLTTLVLHFKRL